MVHYVIVEPANGKLELPDVPCVYEVGELVPAARPELEGVAPVVCAIVESDKAPGRLQRHLADQLILSKPTSGDAVLRYYDPRVFPHLRRILKPEQLGALLGPVAAWTSPRISTVIHACAPCCTRRTTLPTPKQWLPGPGGTGKPLHGKASGISKHTAR